MSPAHSEKAASEEPQEEKTTTTEAAGSPTPDEEVTQKATNTESEGSKDSSPAQDDKESIAPPTPQWQAVWAPQYNAYYFYDPVTQQTTWTNPLQPEASGSSSPSATAAEGSLSSTAGTADANAEASSSSGGLVPSAVSAQYAALHAAAEAQGIDPLLAHLDPSLRASVQGTSALPGDVPTFTAQFNAQTGKFAPTSARTPGHLSEYERAKRMSEFYFDVNQWEQDRAKDQEEEEGAGKKRKRPTKKDLERFKEQKKQKKIAKTAWLRS